MPRPPTPPAQRIIHTWKPLPSKPRDIIVERWLPYKFSKPSHFVVEPAPPYKPHPVRNVIITHSPQAACITHLIDKDPRPIPNIPETYTRQHGPTLLCEQELMARLFGELSATCANEDIVSHAVCSRNIINKRTHSFLCLSFDVSRQFFEYHAMQTTVT